MVKEYVEKLIILFDQIKSKKISDTNFEIKHFFSGGLFM